MTQRNDIINQVIVTIQGEGPHSGYPSLLVRFKGCNCRCPFCDSKETWEAPTKPFIDIDLIMKDIKDKFGDLKFINLIVTGGEPSIYFNYPPFFKLIMRIINELNIRNVDIETNGTGCNFLISYFVTQLLCDDQFNRFTFVFSPKIHFKSNLKFFISRFISNYNFTAIHFNTILKLVDDDQIFEIVEREILPYISFNSNCYLMPVTPYEDGKINFDKFRNNCKKTIEKCLKYGYIFCNREHIWIFGEDKNEATS